MNRLIWIFLFISILLLGCSPKESEDLVTVTPEGNSAGTSTAEAAVQSTQSAQSTVHAQETLAANNAIETQAAQQILEADHATATFQMEVTNAYLKGVADKTETAVAAAARTQTAIMDATQMAAPMVDLVNQLASEEMIQGTKGTFFRLMDFKMDWAQLNWFMWHPTWFDVSNFILNAEMSYKSASDTADWWASGCGFVFRLQPDDNHNFYSAFVTLDGYGEIARWKNGNGTMLSRGYYGKLDLPEGNLNFTLVAEDTIMSVYINEERVVRVSDSAFSEGSLNYTLASGTNKDFGTSCEITEIDLWMIE